MDLDATQMERLADSLVKSHDELLSRLVAMRKKHDLTQGTVAERMGVSQPTVSDFERYDSNPTLATVRRYALAVGASIDHYVDDRCCDFEDTAFMGIVTGASDPWVLAPTKRLSWGQAEAPALVE